MDFIDEKIKKVLNATIHETKDYEHIIKNTLYEEKMNNYNILKFVASFMIFILTTVTIGFGGIYAYSALGGNIDVRPVLDFFGIKIPDSYYNYEMQVDNQSLSFKETSLDLVSAMADEGITLLKFNVKLSEEDKKYLKIGEKIYTDEEILKMKNNYDNKIKQLENSAKDGEISYDILEEKKEKYRKQIENEENYTNTIQLSFNNKPVYVDEYGDESDLYVEGLQKSYMRNFNGNRFLIIDGENTWIECSIQKTEKISEYEYNVYQLYFLSEKEIQNKKDFTLMFNNIAIINMADENDRLNKDVDGILNNTLNNERFIELNGSLNVDLSKQKALDYSKDISFESQEINYGKINQKISKVMVTPMQIVIKSTVTLNNISFKDLVGLDINKRIPNFKTYNIYDQNNNSIENFTFEERRIITYSNGKEEEWDPGEIDTYYDFENATMEITEYTIVENNGNYEKICLYPVVTKLVYDEKVDKFNEINEQLENCFKINLK